jgi:hypothetical protein
MVRIVATVINAGNARQAAAGRRDGAIVATVAIPAGGAIPVAEAA